MKPNGTLAFIDVETTETHPELRRAWDIALIIRTPDGAQTEHQWFVSRGGLDLGNANPYALAVGKFYGRHPQANGSGSRGRFLEPLTMEERTVLSEVERLTRGARLVAWNVEFDATTLDRRMRANGILPAWDYHLIDVRPLAAGYLTGVLAAGNGLGLAVDAGDPSPVWWDSERITGALGVDLPPEEDRHTGLGDARWHMALYDAVVTR